MIHTKRIIIIAGIAAVISLLTGHSSAQTPDTTVKPWNMHYQFTAIDQYHSGFHALYSGFNSLQNTPETAMTITSTLFAGLRLWHGGSLYFNPEISGGKGFSGATGIAGFPNGESFRVSESTPQISIARFFVRQRINLGNGIDTMTDDINQVWEKVSPTNLTLTAGKISLADIFDNNKYAHDPRTQFLNWALMDGGAWDFPADTRGYTYAFILEYNLPRFSFRGAVSAEPTVANGPDLEFVWGKAAGYTFETEYRTSSIIGRPGVIRLLLFDNFSRAGNYDQAVDAFERGTDTSLNVNSHPGFGGSKTGFNLGIEQELNTVLGAFLRVGWNDGNYASWAFTEIDRSASVGINLLGSLWKRNDDNIGLALCINGISNEHQRFLNAGGYGFIIGDGKLTNYGTENILETYYLFKLISSLYASADYQLIENPANNKDRGPVNVFSARIHVAF